MPRRRTPTVERTRPEPDDPSEAWSLFDRLLELHAAVAASERGASRRPDPGSWASVDEFVASYAGLLASLRSRLEPLLREWDRVLAPWGGDPTREDWRRFRPLRLSREEDWSDWLAFLLERSETGRFAASMLHLAGDATERARPRVDREVDHERHRADLVVRWAGGRHTHLEVKVGDTALGKTFATGRSMRRRYGVPADRWDNFILLVPSQRGAWGEVPADASDEPPVAVLTWIDVCVGLRRALVAPEPLAWKAWAFAFVGATEQVLLGFAGGDPSGRLSPALEQKLEILREGLRRG
jgi:hypothetical protein